MRAWLSVSGNRTEGPLFRSVLRGDPLTTNWLDGGDVSRILKRAERRARVRVEHLSGHSLRSGLVTAATKAGKPVHVIQTATGHRSTAVLQGYVRDAERFADCAATGIRL